MSLLKAIKYGKEKRKPHSGSQTFDYSCKCHGTCGWCEGNRKHFDRKHRNAADKDLKDFWCVVPNGKGSGC